MTIYLLIGLSWGLVGLALLVLRLLDEREPTRAWRLLLGAAAAPFIVGPLAGGCGALMAQVASLVPVLGSPWPLGALAGVGMVLGSGRVWLVWRRERAILAACRAPASERAVAAQEGLRRLSEAAGLHRLPRLLVYPRGAYVCALGLRRPAIVVSENLLRSLDEEEIEAILAHEVAHLCRRDYVRNWLGLLARAALFFLPAGILSGWRFAEARERQADDLAVAYTGKPLALAAALVAVWQRRAEGLELGVPTGLVGDAGGFEGRVRRLLDPHPAPAPRWRASLSVSLLAVGILLAQTAVDGGAHALARVDSTIALAETCCDASVSPLPHCVPSRRIFSTASTMACSTVAPSWPS